MLHSKWPEKDGEAMIAAIYCRVSTDNQEREGTSLQTQLEACLKYCQSKGYDVGYRYSEAYSGLSLERPELEKLRELVRDERIDVIICYSLDRLSRDPGHGVIITQELEKHGVKLETVTEDVDNSELGKLISYIRGYASKVEAEKIRERTMRGKKARAKEGRMSGGFHRTYGYDYVKVAFNNGGRRVINENEASWVKQIYEWLVKDGLSGSAITHRLRALNAPTKSSQFWNRTSVLAILKNPAYTGKTYAFTTLKGRKARKPESEWIEIADVTPAIISHEIFEAAQKQLQINRKKASRNKKREYLLSGHLYCHRCGRAYWGYVDRVAQRYRCPGTQRIVVPINRCHNKSWKGDKLEALVWTQIERVLDNPELIIGEIAKQRQNADKLGVFETELQQVERQLKALDRDQYQLLQWALKGFPESQVETECRRMNNSRETLEARKTELESQVKASQDAVITLPKLEHTVELLREQLKNTDFATKRDFIESMGIRVWLDGESVEITGVMPVTDDVIVTTRS